MRNGSFDFGSYVLGVYVQAIPLFWTICEINSRDCHPELSNEGSLADARTGICRRFFATAQNDIEHCQSIKKVLESVEMQKEISKKFDVAIVGGGASGMMAVIQAAKENRSVILIEKNPTLGRKILATGNGRCNLTNRLAEKSRYHGGNQNFIEAVLKQFDQFQTQKFFENLGVVLKEEDNGRIFPRTNSAQTIVDALMEKIGEENIAVKTNAIVKKIEKLKSDFEVTLNSGQIFIASKIILSCGGQASPQFGSSGDGYYWAKLLGHKITEIYPALVPIETKEAWPSTISGLKVEGRATVTVDDDIIAEKSGDILFTHFGLSAPAIMALAGSIGPNLGHDIKIHLDLVPDITSKELDQLLAKMLEKSGKKTLKNTLAGLVPANLSNMILTLKNLPGDKKSAEISKENRIIIAQTLKDLTLTVKSLRPFKEAQVTHGGIALDDIDVATLQSKITPGLYFAGEILNVDGDSGGFNLQWAWSSGHLAGQLK